MSFEARFRELIKELSRLFVGGGNTWHDQLLALRFREIAIGAESFEKQPDLRALQMLNEHLTFLIQKLSRRSQEEALLRLPEFIAAGHALVQSVAFDQEDRLPVATSQSESRRPAVFIGHGRSEVWLQLQVFLVDQLDLDWKDFDRFESVGGCAVQHILDSLKQSSFAFLIMTREDRGKSGGLSQCPNIVHELGLCQGCLGLDRAVSISRSGLHDTKQYARPKDDPISSWESQL